MKVAIDISPLKSKHKFRGVGFYTKRLIQSLKKYDKKNKYIFIDQQSTINNQQFDLIHYPYFDLFWSTLPLGKPRKTVVTIHDVTPLVFPDKFPPGIKGKIKFQIQKFSLKGVEAVICDSKNSKKDIIKYLDFSKSKIHVVYLAPGEEFKPISSTILLDRNKEKYNLSKKFILYVGDVNWNKNIFGLTKAFSRLEPQISNLKLVLVGKAFKDKDLKETKEILQLIKELGLINQTEILGYVPDKDLVAIYNLATVYCQPSFYEGFGLPVLEAMACGTPVVAAKTSSLPEICSAAAIMVNPYKTKDIAKGIEKVLRYNAVHDTLRKKGLKQVKKFNWEKTARETVRVYEKVYRQGK